MKLYQKIGFIVLMKHAKNRIQIPSIFFFYGPSVYSDTTNVHRCQIEKLQISYIGGWVFRDVRVDRGDPPTRFRMGCDRGMPADKHPRDVRLTDRRHCHRKFFPATFRRAVLMHFSGIFSRSRRKMVISD